MKTFFHLSRIATLVSASMISSGTSAADLFFDFNTDGALPSSQGAIYQGGTSEASAYAVSNGMLHMDTFAVFPAAYQFPNVLNMAADITIEWRARVVQTVGTDFGPALSLCSGPYSWTFAMTDTGIFEHSGFHLSTGDGWDAWSTAAVFSSGEFHTFELFIPANSLDYNLFLDDVLRYSGTATATDPSKNFAAGSLYLGEGLTSSINRSLSEWDYVQIQNVPEPSGFTLLSATCAMLVIRVWFRSTNRIAMRSGL
jgi:hypothetical protein